MAFRPRNWLDRIARERARASWARFSRSTDAMRPARLRILREEAGGLRADLDRFLLLSSRRAAASRAELAALPLPGGTDWRWRPGLFAGPVRPEGVAAPAPGRVLTDGAALWHDCGSRAIVARQLRNAGATDLAAFGLRIETFGFTGGFISLAVELPPDALRGLTRNHILRFETAIQTERAVAVYARLNVGNGPNTEELLSHFGRIPGEGVAVHVAEYDLALTEMNEKRLDKVWLDLIFEKPAMNAVVIRDMIFSRHPRANL